jgi:anti-sigma factor RsiW
MTCREFTEFLLDYHAGALRPAERARFDGHLAECEACVAYLGSYDATIRLGKGAFAHPDDPVPDEVPEELVQAIIAARRNR